MIAIILQMSQVAREFEIQGWSTSPTLQTLLLSLSCVAIKNTLSSHLPGLCCPHPFGLEFPSSLLFIL